MPRNEGTTYPLNMCEAELMAIKETNVQVIHLQTLLTGFGESQEAPTIVHMNRKAAHDSLISKNFSKRLKHVTIKRRWVLQELASDIIEVKHVRTYQQHVDSFTKPILYQHSRTVILFSN